MEEIFGLCKILIKYFYVWPKQAYSQLAMFEEPVEAAQKKIMRKAESEELKVEDVSAIALGLNGFRTIVRIAIPKNIYDIRMSISNERN